MSKQLGIIAGNLSEASSLELSLWPLGGLRRDETSNGLS